MRVGNLTQTVWKRSVLKQLHKYALFQAPVTDGKEVKAQVETLVECPCTVMEAGSALFVTAKAVVSGNRPEAVRYGIARAVNDLYIRGVYPKRISLDIIFPESAEESEVKRLISQAIETVEYVNENTGKTECGSGSSSAKEDGKRKIDLTVGNAQVNPAVRQMLIHLTAQGSLCEERSGKRPPVLFASGAKPGQDIIMCGYAGLEGTLRILEEREEELGRRFVPAFLRDTKEKGKEVFFSAIDCTEESYGISAVYQVSDGGILAALWELAENSDVGLQIEFSKISICQETVEICEFYRLNPYLMTSAGCVLFTAEHGNTLLHALQEAGIKAVRLGTVTAEHARIITNGEEIRYLDRPAQDELMRWYRET